MLQNNNLKHRGCLYNYDDTNALDGVLIGE